MKYIYSKYETIFPTHPHILWYLWKAS